VDWWQFVLVVLVATAFFGLIAWLRTGSDGGLRSPGEPGDADRVPPDDVRW